MTSYIRGLGTLKIKGIGTIEYDVIDDKGNHTTLTIHNAYYVSDLKIRLLSPQQVCSQYNTIGSYGGKN